MIERGVKAWLVCVVIAACSSHSGNRGVATPDAAGNVGSSGDHGPSDSGLPDGTAPPISGNGASDAGLAAGQVVTREVPGFAKRPYHLYLPTYSTPLTPTPVIIVFHGGGGNAESTAKLSCPNGDESDPGCLNHVAARHGFAVAYANGQGGTLAPNVRTWNAGGGVGSWQCVSGAACSSDVDDVTYFDALLLDLSQAFPLDAGRVYLTGISNGAAMCHRLACERADRVAAIAPISGENQFQTSGTCKPARAVSVLDIHGTADPCWAFDGGTAACAQNDGKAKLSVAASIAGWVERLGCNTTPAKSDLPDTTQDGCMAHVERYNGCTSGTEVELVRVEGGGHTWPDGMLYSKTVGPLCTDFDADELMLAFFEAHPGA